MAKETILLAQLDLDVDGLLKSATASKAAITQLISELVVLKSTGEESSAQFRKMQDDMQKLTQVFDAQIKAIKEQIKKNDDLADAQKSVTKAVNKTVNAQEELAGTYVTAAGALEEFEQTSRNAAATLQNVNAGLNENKNLMAQGSTAVAEHGKTFNDYKEQVAGAVADLNIFNGGLGGLMSRMDEAGGAGPLLSKSFKSISEGIGGMTKSSLAFIATPMGAVIAAIGLVLNSVISYFSDTQEGIDKVTAVTRPLQAVFQALMGVFQNVGKFLVDAFSSPQKSMSEFGDILKGGIMTSLKGMMELVPALGKAVDLLFKGEFSKAGKVAADAVGKVLLGTDNITGKIADAAAGTGKFLSDAYNSGKRLDTLQKELDKGLADYTKKNADYTLELNKQNAIADNGNKTFAQRETAATRALVTLKEQNKLMADRVAKELEVLKLKLAANGLTDAENVEIAEMAAKYKSLQAQNVEGEKAQAGKIKSIRNEAYAHRAQQRQKELDDAVTKQKQELDLFAAKGSLVAKNQREQIQFEQESSNKRLELLKKELAAKQINQTEYTIAVIQETNSLSQKVSEINIEYSRAALNLKMQESVSKLENEKTLTQALIKEENERLENNKKLMMEQLALEKGVIAAVAKAKYDSHQELSIKEQEFMTEELAAEKDLQDKKQVNVDAYNTQEKQREADEKAAKRMVDLAEAQTDYEEKVIQEDIRHDDEMTRLTQMLLDKKITQDQFTKLERAEENETSRIKTQLAIQNAKTQIGTMQSIATALGDAFGQSKEMAIAQASMNGAQAILSIWAGHISGNPIVDGIIKGVLTAATTAKTAKEIQSIKSTKKPSQPKFEKGGLMDVGGNRHSAGGTLFHGADGTTFEAEQGELIGVMNRNAARHFMAFNNAFPAGGAAAPNYFANGGIVSREITPQGLNIDELAGKLAQANRAMPAPIVAVQDIINEGNSYVRVRDGANF
jgi:hypothetical protein